MNAISAKVKIAEIFIEEIPSDVLARIEGDECLTNNGIMELDGVPCDIQVFLASTLEKIIMDEEDDTNEVTKSGIIDLYNAISGCTYFMVIKMF